MVYTFSIPKGSVTCGLPGVILSTCIPRRIHQTELKMNPKDYEPPGLKQILSGLTSIINGLANLRNNASDSHATAYRPSRRHAELISNFIFNSMLDRKLKRMNQIK